MALVPQVQWQHRGIGEPATQLLGRVVAHVHQQHYFVMSGECGDGVAPHARAQHCALGLHLGDLVAGPVLSDETGLLLGIVEAGHPVPFLDHLPHQLLQLLGVAGRLGVHRPALQRRGHHEAPVLARLQSCDGFTQVSLREGCIHVAFAVDRGRPHRR